MHYMFSMKHVERKLKYTLTFDNGEYFVFYEVAK